MGSAMSSLADAHACGPCAGHVLERRGPSGRAAHAPPLADSACANASGAARNPQQQRKRPSAPERKNKDSVSPKQQQQQQQQTMQNSRTKTKTIAATSRSRIESTAFGQTHAKHATTSNINNNNNNINTKIDNYTNNHLTNCSINNSTREDLHLNNRTPELDHESTNGQLVNLLDQMQPTRLQQQQQQQQQTEQTEQTQKSMQSGNNKADLSIIIEQVTKRARRGRMQQVSVSGDALWCRDHRSLSTSSSLGSSASSSSNYGSNWRHHLIDEHSSSSASSSSSSSAESLRNSSSSRSSGSLLTSSDANSKRQQQQQPQKRQPKQQQQKAHQLINQLSSVGSSPASGQSPIATADPTLLLFYRQQHQQFLQQQQVLSQFADVYSSTPPPPRLWLWSKSGQSRNSQQQQQQKQQKQQMRFEKHLDFTVVSYNVLCDRMANLQMFPDTPQLALDWLYRREVILKQLLDFGADIIALQELELEEFESYFAPEMAELGHYESLFEPKSRARTMDPHRRRRVDGCAIFFKRNKFTLVQRHLLEFNRIAMANARGSDAMLNRVMTKDNIGLAAVLEFIEPPQQQSSSSSRRNRRCNKLQATRSLRHQQQQQQQPKRILVCNTHIHWDPECCDVKLIQTIMLMNELHCIARHHSLSQQLPVSSHFSSTTTTAAAAPAAGINQQDEGDLLLPLVLLGDFNSTPNSGVTSYLTEGQISSLHKDFKSFKYTACDNALSIPSFQQQQYRQLSNPTTAATESSDLLISGGGGGDGSAPMNYLRRQSAPPTSCVFYSHPISINTTTTTTTSDTTSSSAATDSTHHTNGTTSDTEQSNTILNYSHPFMLASAYPEDAMPYTNYTTKFKAIIDYIFFSQDSIQLMAVLGPLDKSWVRGNRYRGFPQPHLPSDHLPLLAKLRYTGPGGGGLDHQLVKPTNRQSMNVFNHQYHHHQAYQQHHHHNKQQTTGAKLTPPPPPTSSLIKPQQNCS